MFLSRMMSNNRAGLYWIVTEVFDGNYDNYETQISVKQMSIYAKKPAALPSDV